MMPDVGPPIEIVEPATIDYALPSGLIEQAKGFRVLSSPGTLEPSCANTPEANDPDANIIVVCAPSGDYRLGKQLPDPPTTMEEIGKSLNLKLGPLELGSIDRGDGSRALGMRIKF